MRSPNKRLMTGLYCLVLMGIVAGAAHGQTATAPAGQAEASQAGASQSPAPASDAKDGQTTTVTVTGQKPVNRIDRQTYDNTKNIDATTGNAADALNKVPSVNVDPQGNVTLRGNSNVQIYVDGKPSTMMSADNRAAALQAMSSGDISSVEVMTNPGAQYSSEGSGGIINLVMNKNRKPGGYGSLTASVGTDGRYNTNLSGSYHKDKLTVNGGFSYRNDIRGGSVGTRLQRLDNNGNVTSTTDTDGTGIGTVRNLSSNVSLDYNATASDSVSASLAYANRQFNIRGDSNNAAYNAANAPTALYGRHTYVQQPNENTSGAFTWTHTGDTTGETLKVDYRISRSTGAGVTENTTTYSFPAVLTLTDMQHKSTDLHNQVLSVDYNRQLGSDQLSTGVQITRDDSQTINNSIVNGVVNPQLTSNFAYVQTISAAYAISGGAKTYHGSVGIVPARAA